MAKNIALKICYYDSFYYRLYNTLENSDRVNGWFWSRDVE